MHFLNYARDNKGAGNPVNEEAPSLSNLLEM